LAYKHNFVTSKHSQLRGWFNKKFVYDDKTFDDSMSKTYEDVFTYRQKSDYDAVYVPDEETSKELLTDAEKFIKEVLKLLLNK